jgi:hypothetical protein
MGGPHKSPMSSRSRHGLTPCLRTTRCCSSGAHSPRFAWHLPSTTHRRARRFGWRMKPSRTIPTSRRWAILQPHSRCSSPTFRNTEWRINSEVLPLDWRNVDFTAGELRLDAGTTKNGEARIFPFTSELRTLLKERDAERKRLKKAGVIMPLVFFRLTAKGRGGPKEARGIKAFKKAWESACKSAGCPGRIPHDLRRTAIRAMIRRGISERVAMMLSGYKTRSVFDRYNIVSHGDLRDAAQKLDSATRTKTGARGA